VQLQDRLIHSKGRFPDNPADQRDRVLQAAAELFMSHGYDATTTDAIARAAGVKPTALYRQFGSKEAMLYAFLETVFQGFLADMQESVAGIDDPGERLVRLAWSHTWLQLSTGTIPRAHINTMFSAGQLMSSLSEESATRLRALGRAHFTHVRTVIDDGIRRGLFRVPDSRSAALAVTTMCEYSVLWFRPGGPLTPEEIADRHALYALRIVEARVGDLEEFAARATGRTERVAVPPRRAKEEGHAGGDA
jgi:AcrR family transcriptional regulator